jgi:hypothetical protein
MELNGMKSNTKQLQHRNKVIAAEIGLLSGAFSSSKVQQVGVLCVKTVASRSTATTGPLPYTMQNMLRNM